jgi:hypothetical protein
MLEKVICESEDKGVHYTELRARTTYSSMLSNLTLKEKTHKVAMNRILTQDPESLFSSFPPKLRSQIRRPTKEGCHVVSVTGNEVNPSQINQFFSVFSQNMRGLGTPVFPKELFSETLSAFGKKKQTHHGFSSNNACGCRYYDRES